MRWVCSESQVRKAEAGAGVPEPVLMQRAASGLSGACVDVLRHRRGSVRGSHVVALVGSGNNGGDALWALARLRSRGASCVAIGDPARMHAPGAAAALAAGARIVAWDCAEAMSALSSADLALDGIVGIGGSGGLREPAARAVQVLARAGVPIIAVDLPSGVDTDSGQVVGAAVRAYATVCFGLLKAGLLVGAGREHAGTVALVEIGLAPEGEPEAWALSLPDLAVAAPAPADHKYRRGVVGVVAGSSEFPGAALLAVGGARRSGAGMVAFSSPGPVRQAPSSAAPSSRAPADVLVPQLVVARYPDVVLSPDRRVDARCVGPGLGSSRPAVEAVLAALADRCPLVIDASALEVVGTREGRAALAERSAAGLVSVLTPHAGEFVRLGFDPAGGVLAAAQRAARETGAVVVHKGPGTIVAAPGGPTFVDTFGSAELATAGSGDVLAGLLAGMLAGASVLGVGVAGGGVTPAQAALVAARAVGLHGLAGRLAGATGGPVTATDVLARLPDAHAEARRSRVDHQMSHA
ncbi:MAG: NAD(P)H-hydrate epimerase [Candidatus Nanopelagicales bacterium]